MSNHPNRWYWCRLLEKNDWTICRWSGSHWYAADYALEQAPQVIGGECLHEPIADDDPRLLAARERDVTMLLVLPQVSETVGKYPPHGFRYIEVLQRGNHEGTWNTACLEVAKRIRETIPR